jgi:hypothetical protein
MVKARVYLADIDGELRQPSGEIGSMEWTYSIEKYSLTDIASQVVTELMIEDRVKKFYY